MSLGGVLPTSSSPPVPVYRPCISASSSSTEAFNVYLVCHDIISWFVTTSNDFAILLRFVTEESSEFPNLFSCKGLERALRLKVDLRFLLALKNWLSRETIWVKLLQFVLCIQTCGCICLYSVVRHTVGSLTFFEVCTATLSLSLGNKIAHTHTNGNGVCCCSFFFLSAPHNEILANYTKRLLVRL